MHLPQLISMKTKFVSVLILVSASVVAQSAPSAKTPGFAPLEKWRAAVQAGDSAKVKSLYSDSAKIQNPKKEPISLADDVQFWAAARNGLSLETANLEPP